MGYTFFSFLNLPVLLGATSNVAESIPATSPSTRPSRITLTIVYDNNKHDPRLETAWGFACVIAGPEKTILFDTGGEGRILLSNMRLLRIDPRKIDIVVLSHSHRDHTGGLDALLRKNNDVMVYGLASFPPWIEQTVKRHGASYIKVKESREICRGLHSTGGMGKAIKEQALVIETKKGLAVVTGCAHPGIVEITRKAGEVSASMVDLVLGGFHLGGASDQQLKSIIRDLSALGVKRAGPCHCSGDRARQLFKGAFPTGFIPAGAGTQLYLERPSRSKEPSEHNSERRQKCK